MARVTTEFTEENEIYEDLRAVLLNRQKSAKSFRHSDDVMEWPDAEMGLDWARNIRKNWEVNPGYLQADHGRIEKTKGRQKSKAAQKSEKKSRYWRYVRGSRKDPVLGYVFRSCKDAQTYASLTLGRPVKLDNTAKLRFYRGKNENFLDRVASTSSAMYDCATNKKTSRFCSWKLATKETVCMFSSEAKSLVGGKNKNTFGTLARLRPVFRFSQSGVDSHLGLGGSADFAHVARRGYGLVCRKGKKEILVKNRSDIKKRMLRKDSDCLEGYLVGAVAGEEPKWPGKGVIGKPKKPSTFGRVKKKKGRTRPRLKKKKGRTRLRPPRLKLKTRKGKRKGRKPKRRRRR